MPLFSEKMVIIKSQLELIGQTPIIHLNGILGLGAEYADIYVDLLHLNPSGSHKDLAYLSMIEAKEREGLIGPDTELVEFSTGNASSAGAFICAEKGYNFVVFVPEDMTREKIQQTRSYRAEVHLTPANEFIVGAVERAVAYCEEDPKNRVLLNQSANPYNAKGYSIVGRKFAESLDSIDALVCGSGTHGVIRGVSEELKQYFPELYVVCLESPDAPHIHAQRNDYEFEFCPHKFIGFGPERLPALARPELYNDVRLVDKVRAEEMMFRLHGIGLFVGKTSGANIYHAIEVAREIGPGKKVVTVTYDSFFKIRSEYIK